MKKLILDHFRRWWWVLALGAAYALVLGWSVAIPADSGELWHGKKSFLLVWLKVQSNMFVSQVFCLAVFTGAMLLLFDLQRGVTRVVHGSAADGQTNRPQLVAGDRRHPGNRLCRAVFWGRGNILSFSSKPGFSGGPAGDGQPLHAALAGHGLHHLL